MFFGFEVCSPAFAEKTLRVDTLLRLWIRAPGRPPSPRYGAGVAKCSRYAAKLLFDFLLAKTAAAGIRQADGKDHVQLLRIPGDQTIWEIDGTGIGKYYVG